MATVLLLTPWVQDVLGNPALVEALSREGFTCTTDAHSVESVDYVVMGETRDWSLNKAHVAAPAVWLLCGFAYLLYCSVD